MLVSIIQKMPHPHFLLHESLRPTYSEKKYPKNMGYNRTRGVDDKFTYMLVSYNDERMIY